MRELVKRCTTAFFLCLFLLVLMAAAQAAADEGPLEVQLSARWAGGGAADGLQEALVDIEVTNAGTRPVKDLTITGSLPAGATVSWAEVGASKSAAGVTWSIEQMAPGETRGPYQYRVSGGLVTAANPTVQATAGPVTTAFLSLRGLTGEPNLTKTLLPNGLTVLTLERPDTPTVAIRVAVLAGARNEDDTTAGGSHWLEHAHFLGTRKYPGGMAQLDGAIERVGGSMNATTGSELTSYFNLVPAGRFDVGLEVLSEQLLHSTFPEEAFNRERQVVFEELKRRNDTPSIRASDLFLGAVFQQSPLRRHPAGTIESVHSIPISTILAYRAQRYVSGNAAVAVAGNVRHAEVVAAVKAAFAPITRGTRIPVQGDPEPARLAPLVLAEGAGTRQAELRLGVPVSGLDNQDQYALTLLDEVLDGGGRRLVTEIREGRGLASQVSSNLSLYSDAGFWVASVSTTPGNAEQVRDLILVEMRRLKEDPVPAEELERTKRFLTGRRVLSEESNSSQAGRLASRELLGFPESAEEFAYRVRQVTPGDVQRVAQKYLDTENYTLVVVRD